MPDGNPIKESLRVALHRHRGLVRVLGRGSYRISPALKEFGTVVLDQGAEGIVLDMSECVGMDSTFMGVLAGLAVRFKKEQRSPGAVVLIHLSPKLKRLLGTLGLDRLVEVHLAGHVPEELAALSGEGLQKDGVQVNTNADRSDQMETMLQAHEDLVNALPENMPQFKDVIEFLRQDVRRNSSEAPSPG